MPVARQSRFHGMLSFQAPRSAAREEVNSAPALLLSHCVRIFF
jgi:hypothetical protein